jgi:predicted GIY-YIG superfamily endonuclease
MPSTAKKRLKKYPRLWKLNLILEQNREWRDLAEGLNA